MLEPENSPLHQEQVRVQRQERRFTTICSRSCFTPPCRGSSIAQYPEGIIQRPPLKLGLRLRLRVRLRLRQTRAYKVEP